MRNLKKNKETKNNNNQETKLNSSKKTEIKVISLNDIQNNPTDYQYYFQFIPEKTNSTKACLTHDLKDAVHTPGKAFWVSDPEQGHRMKEAEKREWLMVYIIPKNEVKNLLGEKKEVDYATTTKGETGHPTEVLIKSNEKGGYGIGAERIQDYSGPRRIITLNTSNKDVKSYLTKAGPIKSENLKGMLKESEFKPKKEKKDVDVFDTSQKGKKKSNYDLLKARSTKITDKSEEKINFDPYTQNAGGMKEQANEVKPEYTTQEEKESHADYGVTPKENVSMPQNWMKQGSSNSLTMEENVNREESRSPSPKI